MHLTCLRLPSMHRRTPIMQPLGKKVASVLALCCVALAPVPTLGAESSALLGYNATISESSISGISSGAFMAVQFAAAWSSLIKAWAYPPIPSAVLALSHPSRECVESNFVPALLLDGHTIRGA